MAAVSPPLALNQGGLSHSASTLRSIVTAVSPGVSGIIAATDLAVAQHGTPNMSVDVAAGQCIIAGSTAFQFGYSCWNDATTNLVIGANSSGSTRIDLILARIHDNQFDAGGVNSFTLEVLAGTPGAGVPATPVNSLCLAQVSVANAAASIVTANITDTRKRYVLGQPSTLAYGGPNDPVVASYFASAAITATTFGTGFTAASVAVPAFPYPTRQRASGSQQFFNTTATAVNFHGAVALNGTQQSITFSTTTFNNTANGANTTLEGDWVTVPANTSGTWSTVVWTTNALVALQVFADGTANRLRVDVTGG